MDSINSISSSTVGWNYTPTSQSTDEATRLRKLLVQLGKVQSQLPSSVQAALSALLKEASAVLTSGDSAEIQKMTERFEQISKISQGILMQQAMVRIASMGNDDDTDTSTTEDVDTLSGELRLARDKAKDAAAKQLLDLLYSGPLGYDSNSISSTDQNTITDSLVSMLGLDANP